MAEIWTFLEDDISRYWFGSIAALVCVLIAYLASLLIRDDAKLKTVLALFACGWVLQMGAYGAPREALSLVNLATDLVSFVHIFAGVLLIDRLATPRSGRLVGVLQGAAFWLLIALILPRRQEFHGVLDQAALSLHQMDQLTALALTLIGFFAIGAGAWVLSRGALFWLLALSLAVYAGLNVMRFLELWTADAANIPRLSSEMVLAFAVAKIAMTALFSTVVVAADQREG